MIKQGNMMVAIRDGQVKMRAVLTERADGTLWIANGGPLLNRTASGAPANLEALARGGQWDEIPARCFAHLGDNEGGLIVRLAEDYEADQRAERNRYLAAHPEVAERKRVSDLYATAARRLNDHDDDNTSDHFRRMADADAALAAWRKQYPEAAREERRQALLADAAEQESLAVGALAYDADGWLDETERRKRHDEHMAKARDLRAQAKNL